MYKGRNFKRLFDMALVCLRGSGLATRGHWHSGGIAEIVQQRVKVLIMIYLTLWQVSQWT